MTGEWRRRLEHGAAGRPRGGPAVAQEAGGAGAGGGGPRRPPAAQEAGAADASPMGRPPENRRQALVKLVWVVMWLLYLGAPVHYLADRHPLVVTVLAACGLAAFVGSYLVVVFFRASTPAPLGRWVHVVLLAQAVLALLLAGFLGKDWLVLFVYLSVACGAALPPARARWAVPAATALLTVAGASTDSARDQLPSLLIPALLGGFSMIGIQQLIRTMRELRAARETVAHLAANEERLRLARDLHDLLGHSLSLITLKSELAGRMLPDKPLDAAQQVADIERVSRQALVDVREAVSGYRRPTLGAELASARQTLASAGVSGRLHVPEHTPGLAPDREGALAWALREAVTNVVRHSGAGVCVVALTLDGDTATLTVSDDGRGPDASHPPGNGLTGLAERLVLAGGALHTARAGDGGFVLTAQVPLSTAPVGARQPREGEE